MYITNPEKAHAYLKSVWPCEISVRERVLIVYLDRHQKVLGEECVFVGGRYYCPIDVAIIFQYAVREGAHSILVAHNHPSGSLAASKEDMSTTDQLVSGGKILDIQVGHMVITRADYHVLAFFE